MDEREMVNHPDHYNSHPSGVEVIEIVRYFDFNVGNALKYLMRAPYKGNRLQDTKKALWYLCDARDNVPDTELMINDAQGTKFEAAVKTLLECEPADSALARVMDHLFGVEDAIDWAVMIEIVEREVARLEGLS